MKKYHDIGKIKFEDGFMMLSIDGRSMQFRLRDISSVLENASMAERNNFEISPSGYGIHWPLVDEDLSIDGLLGITHEPKSKKEIA